MSENLKTITIEEIEQKIHDHQLWLKWDSEDKRADFSGYDFNELIESINNQKISNDLKNILSKRAYSVFSWKNLSNSIFEWSNLTSFMFLWTNLKNANFQNTNLKWCLFQDANLSLTDFRNATSFDFSRFNENQIRDAIFTSKEFEEKTSKKLKTQEKIIDNTKEEQTDLLIEGFNKIREDFSFEEKRWLMLSFIWFLNLFLLSLIPILDIIAYQYIYKIIFWWLILITFIFIAWSILIAGTALEDQQENEKLSIWQWIKKWWQEICTAILIYFILITIVKTLWEPSNSIFNIEMKYCLIPFWILFSTFLYFSIFQYSKAKELRIENQNKIALLHGFQAINANELITNKEIFHQNISDVVFTKAYKEKNPKNLPIDKVIDLIKISQK